MLASIKDYISNINFSSGTILGVAWQVPVIIFLIFLLVLTLAQVRRHFVDWSFKGAVSGVALGFLLAVVVEGLMMVYGKTILIQTLGWDNAPKPITVALDAGRNQLTKVLGVSTSVDYQKVIDLMQTLSPSEAKKAKSIICTP